MKQKRLIVYVYAPNHGVIEGVRNKWFRPFYERDRGVRVLVETIGIWRRVAC